MKKLLPLSLLGLMVTLASCGGGGGGGGGGGSQGPSKQTSPYISSSAFVSALNSVDSTFSTKLMLTENQTYRSTLAGQDDWFVVWDASFQEYKAVSLQYVRSIAYYDYYSSNQAVASEFRNIEANDVKYGRYDGDYYGADYEVVDYRNDGYYKGRNSGYLYEDEATTTDVSLMAKEEEQKKFLDKASKVSFVYNVSLETSLSLVTLGEKVEKMLSRGYGELTQEDQLALTKDIQDLTGVTLSEVQDAATGAVAKEDVLNKIADKIGTSASNLEQKILPEVFGINL